MARLHPFRALRPRPDAAERVAAVPYDVVTTDEARALAAGNPLSFLHVSRAEIDLPTGADPALAGGVRARAAEFRAAQAGGPRDRRRSRASTSIGCAWARTSRPASPRATRWRNTTPTSSRSTSARVATRKTTARGTSSRCGAQTGPVFLTYRASRGGRRRGTARWRPARRSTTSRRPTASATRSGGRATRTATALVAAFERIPALYIADGHHRAASAARARTELAGRGAPADPLGRRRGLRDDARGRVPARPDAGAAVQPDRAQDLGGLTPDGVPRGRARAVRRRAGAGRAGEPRADFDVLWRARGTRCGRQRAGSGRRHRAARRQRPAGPGCSRRCCRSPTCGPTSASISSAASAARRRSSGGRARRRGRRLLDVSRQRGRPDGGLRRGRHHAAQVARGSSPSSATAICSSHQGPTSAGEGGTVMKVLVADKFETDRPRRPARRPAARSSTSRISKDDALAAAIRDTRRRRPRRPQHRGDRADARRRARSSLVVRAGAGYNTIDVKAASRARHLRLELPRQERHRRRGAGLRR